MKRPHTNFWEELELGYHNDKPLYIGTAVIVTIALIIAVAIKLNS